MVRVRVTCILGGPRFSPSVATTTTGLDFHRSHEPGAAAPIQGRVNSGGRAELLIQEYGELDELIGRNGAGLMALGRSAEALRRCGATEIALRFEVEYTGQCQFELPPDLLRRLADLGIPVGFACFASDETEELQKARSQF